MMGYEFKVGDRVMGTKDALSHRVGTLGRVTRLQGKGSAFVLWDGADQDHFAPKNEIVLIEEEPMDNVTQEPKLWRDMTPEEKGALLLAQYEGKVIQYLSFVWEDGPPQWFDNVAYRVKPEPKRETLKLYNKNGWYDPAIGTIDLIDGKPDLSSLKLEDT